MFERFEIEGKRVKIKIQLTKHSNIYTFCAQSTYLWRQQHMNNNKSAAFVYRLRMSIVLLPTKHYNIVLLVVSIRNSPLKFTLLTITLTATLCNFSSSASSSFSLFERNNNNNKLHKNNIFLILLFSFPFLFSFVI